MKPLPRLHRLPTPVSLLAAAALLPVSVFGQFNELQNYGDGRTDGGGPGTFTDNGGGSFTINAGGGDFWGTSDGASFLTASDGSLTTTNDFTATVRHVNTTNPSTNGWGRDGIMARVQPSSGGGFPADNLANTNANSAHYAAIDRSVADVATVWRQTPGGGTGQNPGFSPTGGTPDVTSTFLAIARNGATMNASYAADLGGGTPGRWVTLHSGTHTTIGSGTEVTVGVGHQAHNNIPGGSSAANTATFDAFSFSDGSFDATKFGPAASPGTWQVAARVDIDSDNGAVQGAAYVTEAGAATGEANGWTVTVQEYFHHPSPGLTADIYLGGNPASQAGARAAIASGSPENSVIIPNVNWTGGNNGASNYGGGTSWDFRNGAGFTGTTGSNQGQNNYGVHLTGQIFIPDDATRGGVETISFKDGVDDYTYLGIDGTQLIDDNAWTGFNGSQNGGSPIVTLDVSDPKFDDGEWVNFEMITWEGGGGDAGALYWDALDGDNNFPAATATAANTNDLIPAGFFRHYTPFGAPQVISGTSEIGDILTDSPFGLTLNPGGVYQATVSNINTGTSTLGVSGFVLVPEPSRALLALVGVIAVTLRRRRK